MQAGGWAFGGVARGGLLPGGPAIVGGVEDSGGEAEGPVDGPVRCMKPSQLVLLVSEVCQAVTGLNNNCFVCHFGRISLCHMI